MEHAIVLQSIDDPLQGLPPERGAFHRSVKNDGTTQSVRMFHGLSLSVEGKAKHQESILTIRDSGVDVKGIPVVLYPSTGPGGAF